MTDMDWDREPGAGAQPPVPGTSGASPEPEQRNQGTDGSSTGEPVAEPKQATKADTTPAEELPDSGGPAAPAAQTGAELSAPQAPGIPLEQEISRQETADFSVGNSAAEPVQTPVPSASTAEEQPDLLPDSGAPMESKAELQAQGTFPSNQTEAAQEMPMNSFGTAPEANAEGVPSIDGAPKVPEDVWPQPEFSKSTEESGRINLDKDRDISSGAPVQDTAAQPQQAVLPPNNWQGQVPQQQEGYTAPPYANPYQQYGQYQNPYAGYPNQPYSQQPYGGQYQNPQQPYQQPYPPQQPQYWNYQQPGQQQTGGMPPQPPQGSQPGQGPEEPPRKMSGGLKAFLWILGILAGLFLVAFCVVSINTAVRQVGDGGKTPENSERPSYSEPAPGGDGSSQGGTQEPPKNDATDPDNAGMVIEPRPTGEEMSAKEVYRQVVESVVGVETTADDGTGLASQGSGIIATKSGYIITNAHVVEYSKDNKVSVILHNDETEYSAVVVGYDKTSDLAILKIEADNLKPAMFGDVDDMEIGDQVLAIGNPGGLEFASTLTGGYISALDRTLKSKDSSGMSYIQTDAAINPGNSGGPLVNMYGQVIGINSNKIISTGYEGMGFAIPVSHAKTTIDDLISRGYVSGRVRLGITAGNVAGMQAQLAGLPSGVKIMGIDPESSFSQVGAAVGDIITKADGDAIASMDDLYVVLNRHKPGDEITITLYQTAQNGGNGQSRDVKIKLLEDKGETQNTVSQPTE